MVELLVAAQTYSKNRYNDLEAMERRADLDRLLLDHQDLPICIVFDLDRGASDQEDVQVTCVREPPSNTS
jgi:hypothetical protein